ncbi:hypothetical protein DL238_04040 [Alteriqipengyuania lutimaris]|uniref:Uncharacterized protein n=1 Tax=Alteriqipengyuania lutimaris TaxID=1538146 RepID=A0A395LKH9_9SPHN|nr:hypothetical protein DL238_04040 [Alteriqipengyuania lutimaris]
MAIKAIPVAIKNIKRQFCATLILFGEAWIDPRADLLLEQITRQPVFVAFNILVAASTEPARVIDLLLKFLPRISGNYA